MLELWTREQCEQFQMSTFGISCATCERSDQECPWHRQDEPTIIVSPFGERVIHADRQPIT